MPGFNICGTGGGPESKLDILRTYRWEVSIDDAPVSIKRKYQDLVLDATVPEIDFDILLVQGMSLEYKIPQKPKFNNVDITFYDIFGLQIAFETWTDKIWNPQQGLFEGKAPTKLKGSATIKLLNYEGTMERGYKLHGVWPKRISHSKLDMSSDSLKTIVVEFVYDFYEIV